MEKDNRTGLDCIEYAPGDLVGRRVLPIPWYDIPCHRLHTVTGDGMQLPRSMEAVRRTIDGRTDARRRRNGSLRLPELSVARLDHGIAPVVPVRMVPYKVALS